ncbi:DinB family protein [Mangrovibacillus cuniculi]|uniref:DinB family protein n=1 Tax=Mangrovibacillus cuniculi TaxID=2593652 RepID=UPI0023BAD049|nr:DinB family protein [Mangrovibacillus cuniculi]
MPNEITNKIPPGHKNNILWNAGHILVGWDNTIYTIIGEARKLDPSYHLMFPRGTSPKEWTGNPPSLNEIIELLESQISNMEVACKGKLKTPLKQSFLGMETVEEMILFHMNHENFHMGIVKGMRQALGVVDEI